MRREPEGLSGPIEQRFEAAMRELTDLYETASRFRGLASECERAFSDGLRVADRVRRAVRQGHAERPDASDCDALDGSVGRLQELLAGLDRSPDVSKLRRALATGDHVQGAQLACELFAGLRFAGTPQFGYRGVAVRERGRRGEGIVHHDHLAARLAAEIGRGLAPPTRPASDEPRAALADLPEPITLSPTFDGSGSEIALRAALQPNAEIALQQEQSGDLWIFRERLAGPFAVVLAREADDEWWAASPIAYPSYADALASALAARSIAVIRL